MLGRRTLLLQQKTLQICIGSNPEDEDKHGGYGYWFRNKEGEMILEFCAAKEEGKSSSHLWVWSIQNSGRLLFVKKKPKESFERYKSLT